MITIILPVSRPDYLKEVFSCLSELEKPKDTELLIVIDGDKKLEAEIDRHLDKLSFSVIRLISHTQSPAQTINERRYRISDVHNQAKYCISGKCEYVFLIEDDTTFPPHALNSMLRAYEDDPLAGFVEGVELGRHNTPYIGAWQANSINDPTEIRSVMPGDISDLTQVTNIDAGGLYCCLVRGDLYRKHHFEPYDKEGANGLSCDVDLGLSLRRAGHTCYIDWSVQCEHLSDKGPISIKNTKPAQVVFEKFDDRWMARTA